jgi:hypothetical protein
MIVTREMAERGAETLLRLSSGSFSFKFVSEQASRFAVPSSKKEQYEKFREIAREHGADD